MQLPLVLVIQWLHMLFGIIWFGGYVFLDFVIWPALLRRPASQAQALFSAIAAPTGRLMALSGTLVVLLGIRVSGIAPIRVGQECIAQQPDIAHRASQAAAPCRVAGRRRIPDEHDPVAVRPLDPPVRTVERRQRAS